MTTFGGSPPTAASSDIQSGNAMLDSDPFDRRGLNVVDSTQDPPSGKAPSGFHLIPLVCSAGADKSCGLVDLPIAGSTSSQTRSIFLYTTTSPVTINPYRDLTLGKPISSGSTGAGTQYDNVTNHHIEQR